MIKAVNKVDTKHSQNLVVLTYQDNKGNLKTNCKDKEVLDLVQKTNKEGDDATKATSLVFRLALKENAQNLILAYLGKKSDLNEEAFRDGIAKLYRKLEAEKISHASICLDSTNKLFKKEDQTLALLSEALEVSAYHYLELMTKSKQKPVSIQVKANKTQEKALKTGHTIADAINFAREVADTPANLMTPSILAKRTVAKAKGSKLKVNVWDKTRIEKEKFGCMLGVAQGSAQPPRVIIMTYNGGSKNQKPVTFVGKGLTFDTGGTSLKPSAGMEEMKYDMCGGANVIGAMLAIANLGLKVNAYGIVGATENMPGSKATKPGDVHTARNGLTVEVNNTDAEGRLVMADLLSYVSEKKPAAIIDAATLTGAMVVALGNLHTGFYTTNDKLAGNVEKSAGSAGESVWRMPVTKGHSDDMKGTYADLSNMGSSRQAGSAQAAAFLKEFVPEEIPYAHFDIAGTAWNCQNRTSLFRKGATGSMVRTFTEIAKTWK